MANMGNLPNNAIEEHGFRISPRLSLHERMARYIKLSRAERGENVTDEDAEGAASMILMGDMSMMSEFSNSTRRSSRREQTTDTVENTPRRSSRLREQTTPEPDENTLRRSSRLRSRPTFMEPQRIVTNTSNGLRVTVNTHPMVRRSQVCSHW